MANDANTSPIGNASGAPGSAPAQSAPVLPRPRMPLSQRAKIFIPFDPLKGYREALREKELEAELRHNELAGDDENLESC